MSLEPFATSEPLTLGVELELQIVNTHNYDLTPGASDLLRLIGRKQVPGDIKPEITESMIELSTGICRDYADAKSQLHAIRDALVEAATKLDLGLCGGGTHPFQRWNERRIFDKPRFHYLSELYGYLSKQFTVFGQHVHVGCPGPDEALRLLHGMSRFIPHFIALSAASPFVQGHDTGYNSARLNSVFAFPLSGRAPFELTWDGFTTFFDKMAKTGVVQGMKDFYWDIRPKPEFGTIEIRVMDTPLTVDHAAAIAAYIQVVAHWLQVERPYPPEEDDYLVYTFNRFQACRFGFDGIFVDPKTGEHRTIRDDIVETLRRVEGHAIELKAEEACRELLADTTHLGNGATWIRSLYEADPFLPEVVRQQCRRWK